jgi:arsenate reductase
MAEAWTRQIKGDVIEPYSAGTEPKQVDPRAIKAMAEAGIDLAGRTSKSIDALEGIEFDYVVTVCDHAHQSCPIFPGKTEVVHVGFDDPPKLAETSQDEEEAMAHYRQVRDEIRAFVEGLPDVLTRDRTSDRFGLRPPE